MAFKIQSTTEDIESVAGLALAGKITHNCGLHDLLKENGSYKNALVSMFGLFVQGRSTFEEIDLYRRNKFFRTAFDLSFVPAQEILRKHSGYIWKRYPRIRKYKTALRRAVLQY